MDQLRQYFASRRSQLVEILSQLIRLVTVNPPGQERLAADYVASLLDRWSVPYQTFEAQPGRTNLVAHVGSGRPRLLVACHLDTVPAGDGWDTPPFEPVVRDGKLFGRGASDNKGQLAACLLTLEYLKAHESELAGQFILACVADEEQGSALGMEYLLREGLVAPDLAIIPDAATDMRKVIIAEKGIVFFDLVSHGKQAHGSTPEKGVNAVWNMIDLLSNLRRLQLPGAHSLLGSATMNLGSIEGGVAANVVPARCAVRMDMRFLPGTKHSQVLDLVRAAMRRTESDLPYARFELEVRTAQEPIEFPSDHPLVIAICDETASYLGFRPEAAGIGGSTVAKMCALRDIPAVNFAPGDSGTAHVANEYIPLDQLTDFAGLMVRVAARLIGKGRVT